MSARGVLRVVVHAVRFEQKEAVGLACEITALGPVLSLESGILRRMEDQRDPHYTPFGKAPAARALDPRESLWTLWRDHIEWSCELVFRGESYGWECRVLRDGELTIAQRFVLREHAIVWSEGQRRDIEHGWIDE